MVGVIGMSKINPKYHLLYIFKAVAEGKFFLAHNFLRIVKILLLEGFVGTLLNNPNKLNWDFRVALLEIIENAGIKEASKSRTIDPRIF